MSQMQVNWTYSPQQSISQHTPDIWYSIQAPFSDISDNHWIIKTTSRASAPKTKGETSEFVIKPRLFEINSQQGYTSPTLFGVKVLKTSVVIKKWNVPY